LGRLMRFPFPMPILALTLTTVAALGAALGNDYEEARRLRERREILPLEELLRRAGLEPETRVLEVEKEFEHGRRVYEIEYLSRDGRVREVRIDVDSGAVVTGGH
jgi:uncharacterized membrane protein YkoI